MAGRGPRGGRARGVVPWSSTARSSRRPGLGRPGPPPPPPPRDRPRRPAPTTTRRSAGRVGPRRPRARLARLRGRRAAAGAPPPPVVETARPPQPPSSNPVPKIERTNRDVLRFLETSSGPSRTPPQQPAPSPARRVVAGQGPRRRAGGAAGRLAVGSARVDGARARAVVEILVEIRGPRPAPAHRQAPARPRGAVARGFPRDAPRLVFLRSTDHPS